VFAGETERLARCRQDLHVGAARADLLYDGRRLEDVFEVVQHEQDLLRREQPDERGSRFARFRASTQLLGEGVRHVLRLAHGRQRR
jgi:hypothetical protein